MSFVKYDVDHPFPIQNLPYGVFRRNKKDVLVIKNKKKNKKTSSLKQKGLKKSIGVRIGDYILDLRRVALLGLFTGKNISKSNCFSKTTLNKFMGLGKKAWDEARTDITALLSKDSKLGKKKFKELRERVLVKVSEVKMFLPAKIGDYTDCYASYDHAKNIGTMFRGAEKAIMPNWRHIPIGYHGRASSVVISGTPLVRPSGQTKQDADEGPKHTPCRLLDIELEIGCFVGKGNKLGQPITLETAEDSLFGVVVMNDWSARDIQKWEYVPLGPFCGKNWGTSISPWVVTFAALKPFTTKALYPQEPAPLPYLADPKEGNFDVALQVNIKPVGSEKTHNIANSNMKYLYWTFKQQLIHHSSTGCNMKAGDLIGSGTISGPTKEEYGSLLELCWRGTKPIKLEGEEREVKFLQDGDSVTMSGYAQGNGYRIGLGEVEGTILPAVKIPQ